MATIPQPSLNPSIQHGPSIAPTGLPTGIRPSPFRLQDLPDHLITDFVLPHLTQPKDVSALSLTNRRLHQLTWFSRWRQDSQTLQAGLQEALPYRFAPGPLALHERPYATITDSDHTKMGAAHQVLRFTLDMLGQKQSHPLKSPHRAPYSEPARVTFLMQVLNQYMFAHAFSSRAQRMGTSSSRVDLHAVMAARELERMMWAPLLNWATFEKRTPAPFWVENYFAEVHDGEDISVQHEIWHEVVDENIDRIFNAQDRRKITPNSHFRANLECDYSIKYYDIHSTPSPFPVYLQHIRSLSVETIDPRLDDKIIQLPKLNYLSHNDEYIGQIFNLRLLSLLPELTKLRTHHRSLKNLVEPIKSDSLREIELTGSNLYHGIRHDFSRCTRLNDIKCDYIFDIRTTQWPPSVQRLFIRSVQISDESLDLLKAAKETFRSVIVGG